MLNLLFLSTPVGPLGTGQGGGVELTVKNVAESLQQKGHKVLVAAPAGSRLSGIPVQEIAGQLQIPAQTQSRNAPVSMPPDSVLAAMCRYAYQVQHEFDLIVNFAYDWLPFYLTPFFTTPIAHFISMGSIGEALDQVMHRVAQQYPDTVGVYTRSQADTFAFGNRSAGGKPHRVHILSSGLDLSLYQYNPTPEDSLAWLGRIAPEKALEDAIAAAKIANIPLKIFGKIENQSYWQQIQQNYADAPFSYQGFLPTLQLQQELGKCRALLMTPRWIEAFGNVAIEALACGVPVISYRRGGPVEIVKDGKTGFLVEPDSVQGLVAAIGRLDQIKRADCRHDAAIEYSLMALGDRFEQWFNQILQHQPPT